MAINYALYHPKWSLISRLIRFKRAGGKCERCSCEHGRLHRSGRFTVYLATIHLNHDRRDNRFSNLAALCQACHMWWDHARHTYNRKYGKEIHYQNGLLFQMGEENVSIPKLQNLPIPLSLFRQDLSGSLRWRTLFDLETSKV